MPQLKQLETKPQKFVLPSTAELPEADQAWVVLDVSPILTGDMIGMENIGGQIEISLSVLLNKITDWNYTEADGTTTPITLDNLKRLDVGDYMYLTAQLNGGKVPSSLTQEQKKS